MKDIEKLKIVKALQNRDGDLWSLFELEWRRIEGVIKGMPQGLEYLTPHDIDHCLRVTQRIDQLLPEDLISSLNCSEILVLLYSILYHDIGMWMNKEKLQGKFKFQEFEEEKNRGLSRELYDKLRIYLNNPNSLEGNERYFVRYILDFFIGQYKRSSHPELSAESILEEAKRNGNIPMDIAEAASNIIRSHGWTKEEVLNSSMLERVRVSLRPISPEKNMLIVGYFQSCLG